MLFNDPLRQWFCENHLILLNILNLVCFIFWSYLYNNYSQFQCSSLCLSVFVLSLQPEHSNVCFWYIPPSLRALPPGPDRDARLHQVSAEQHSVFSNGQTPRLQWTHFLLQITFGCTELKKTLHQVILMRIFSLFVQVAPLIKHRMMEKGSVLIGYQPLREKVNFFRCVFSNPATQQEDVDFLLSEIVRLGED